MYSGPWIPDDQQKPYQPGGPGQVQMTAASATPWFGQDQMQSNPPPYGPGYPNQSGYPPMNNFGGGGYASYPPYPPQGNNYGNNPLPQYPPECIALGDYGPAGPPNQTAVMTSSPYRPGNRRDVEGSGSFNAFTDENVRRDFIKKVYALLSLQMAITAAIQYPFMFIDEVQEWADDHWYLMIVFLVVYMIISCAVVCVDSLRRSFPINLILLFTLTIFMGLAMGFITSQYNTQIVFIALSLTCLICFLVTFVACCCPIDITGCGLILCAMTCGLMIFGMIASILVIYFKLKVLVLVYSALAVILFSVWLLYDTQQIMGGKRVELSPEEYVLGALQLYIDLVQIFLNLLPLVAACFGGD